MTTEPTGRLTTCLWIVWGALLVGIAARRPEVAALGVPAGVAVVTGLARDRRLDVAVELRLDQERAIEGERIGVEIIATSSSGVARLEVALRLPAGLEPDDLAAIALRVPPGGEVRERVELICRRWGVHRPCRADVTAYGELRLFAARLRVVPPTAVRVHPPLERLRRMIRPERLQGSAGAHGSRRRSEGIEFAETRPFVPGDRARSVNWRATARRTGEEQLWVDDRHPDRSAELVLLVDSFAEAAVGLDSTLNMAVAAAQALASGHVAAHDRLGVVGLGGVLRWLAPSVGTAHLHRVVDAILDTEVIASEADKGVDVVPVRGLPPRASVVALTPLLDARSLALMAELRARGFDLAVLECAPEPFAPPGPRRAEDLAHRLWLVERETIRAELRSVGVAVTTWRGDEPVAAAVEELLAWRRRWRAVVPA